METIQENFRKSWQENKKTKTIQDIDKKTKKNDVFIAKILEKNKKNFEIPASKTRKPRTSKIFTRETKKMLDFLPRNFYDF